MSEDERRRMVRPPTSGQAAGRNLKKKLKTAEGRTLSSQQWLERQLTDPYVQRAKAEGWRSRAAFKLIEIDDRFRPLKRGAAAVAGVDLLPIEPIPGAELIQADFTEPGGGEQLVELLGGAPDIVLSDMAHNTVGHKQTDHLKIVALIEAAADFAIDTLKPGGVFVTKNFQGGSAGDVLERLKKTFAEVKFVKPKASRADSSEVYLVAMGFKGRS